MKHHMVDVLICAMPMMTDVGRVPPAPAILKAAVEQAGYRALTVDLNLEYFDNQCQRDVAKYYHLGSAWRPLDPFTEQSQTTTQEWTDDCINLIKKIAPRTIAVSVFTNWQHRATWALLQAVKHHLPNIPVIAGGFGCEISAASLRGTGAVGATDYVKPFWLVLKEHKLVDCVALGSGGSLEELVTFLDLHIRHQNTVVPESNNSVIYDAPIPNYDDYKLDQYLWENQKRLAVTGSKGCVRACSFCDIPGSFGRFRYRQGKDIANEIINQYRKHGIRYFEFTDSLVNGSLKAFREWMTILASFNDTLPEQQKIRWFGQYICRPQSQMSGDLYNLMQRSGVTNLIIGVESGSNAVLEVMKKKIKVEDVLGELEQFFKHGINCDILMLSSFYSETPENYEETLLFLHKCQKYLANGTISTLGMGPPMYINDQMPIGQHAEELGIVRNFENESFWTLKDRPENNYVNRVKNRVTAQLVLDLLGYALSNQHISNLHQMSAVLAERESQLLKELNETAATPV